MHGVDAVMHGMRPSECVVLLVSSDGDLEGIVRQAVGSEPGQIAAVRLHAQLAPALDAGWGERIDLAVIDLRGEAENEVDLLAALVLQAPDTPAVIICEQVRAKAVEAVAGKSAHRRRVGGAMNEIRSAIRDVLKERPAPDKRRPSTFDPDDGLPYPSVLMDRIRQSIAAQAREGPALAVLVVELNSTEDPGSERKRAIRGIGRRLLRALANGGTVSYLGENRFGILAPTVGDRGHAVLVAESLLAVLDRPLAESSDKAETNGVIGIAICPEHGRDPGSLLGRAAVAAADARSLNNGCSIYSPSESPRQEAPAVLASDLRDAIEGGGLVLHYQPLTDLRTGRIGTVEALVRWEHSKLGLLPPDEFVPMAEQTGLVLGLTLWVLDEAVRRCASWHSAGQTVTVTVNVSPQTIHGLDLPEVVKRALTRHGLAPSGLALEITEHALIADLRRAGDVLRKIEAMGVRIIIDDFGTGYSSLALLRQLPVRTLKIDLSFVRTIEDDDQDAAMVMSIIDLGHNLGLEVVAEGVESEAIWRLLAAHGCDTAQGFFTGRPVPAEELDLARVVPEAGAALAARGYSRRKGGWRDRPALPGDDLYRLEGWSQDRASGGRGRTEERSDHSDLQVEEADSEKDRPR